MNMRWPRATRCAPRSTRPRTAPRGGGGQAGEAGVWAGLQLAARFHGDTKGGDKFFLLIGRLATDPEQHADLLELMYQVPRPRFRGPLQHRRPRKPATRSRASPLVRTARDSPSPGAARTLAALERGAGGTASAGAQRAGMDHEPHGRVRPVRPVRLVQIPALGDERGPDAAAGRHRADATAEPADGFGGPVATAEGTAVVRDRARQRERRRERAPQHRQLSGRRDVRARPRESRCANPSGAGQGRWRDQAGIRHRAGRRAHRQPADTHARVSRQPGAERKARRGRGCLAAGTRASRPRASEASGQGDAAPLDDNATAQGRARNRRVDIVVSQDSGIDPHAQAPAPARSESPPPLHR
jgi:type VI secretion system protein ImpK